MATLAYIVNPPSSATTTGSFTPSLAVEAASSVSRRPFTSNWAGSRVVSRSMRHRPSTGSTELR
jgi:hypothetical protein